MPARRFRSRDWGLLILLLAAALACIRLGFWQLARLDQRLTRNRAIQSQLEAPVKPFSPVDNDYQRVVLEGVFLPEFEVLLKNRALDEVAGFHLVTPLQLEEGLLILVDRGWIPYEEGSRFELDAFRYESPVRVEGFLQPSQAEPRWDFLADPIPAPGDPPLKNWRLIHIEGIQGQIPSPLHHQYVLLTDIEPAANPMPTPDFQIDLSNGPHLSYAIQWFSFAAIALIGGGVIVRRILLKRR